MPELYRQCHVAYEMLVEGMGLGRIIARPFVGGPGTFKRTSNRRDFAIPPPAETLLDRLHGSGCPVVAIGKIEDLYAFWGELSMLGNLDTKLATMVEGVKDRFGVKVRPLDRSRFEDLAGDSVVTIKQTNEESIHQHDAYAERKATIAELVDELNGDQHPTD